LKSSVSGFGGRQDSFPNLVTLEPHQMNKSVNISTARDFEPVAQEIHTRRSFFDNPIISKVSKLFLSHTAIALK